MKISHEEIRQILTIVEESSFDSIEIQVGETRLAARKSGPLAPPAAAAAAERQAPPAASPAAPTPAAPPPRTAPEPSPAAKPPAEAAQEGLVEVTAPIVGIFYVAPEPGAAPFVQEGDRIDDDTTVGIVEVMKVFTNIRAEKSGTVVRRLVEDGDFVEFGQPILLLRPEA